MYDPKLKKDMSLVMCALSALARDTAERINPNAETKKDKADRIGHKYEAFVELDEALSDRAEELLNESVAEGSGLFTRAGRH